MKVLRNFLVSILSVIMISQMLVLPLYAVSGTVYESEPNNSASAADVTMDDANSYGAISSQTDEDWWQVWIENRGMVNFWIGNIPNGYDYRIQIYNASGSTLLATSAAPYNNQRVVKLQLNAGTYKIRVYSNSGYSVTSYLFRVKNYTIPPLFSGDLLWNIEDIHYYVDSSVPSSMITSIAEAADNWVNTGYGWNDLYPNTRTTNIANSAMDIYLVDEIITPNGQRAYGSTTCFARTNGTTGTPYWVNPDESDWLYCEIKLSESALTTDALIKATVAHEMGHVFGLKENNTNPQSIMCQGASVSTVQEVDHIAFNLKH